VNPSRRLGEQLIERKVLRRDTLEDLLAEEERTGTGLAALLLARRLVSERDLASAVAGQLGLGFFDPQEVPVAPMVVGMLPANLALRLQAVAVDVRDGTLGVAMADPNDATAIGEIEQSTGWKVTPLLATRSDLAALLRDIYPAAGSGREEAAGPVDGAVSGSRLHLNDLLVEMMSLGASDLHLSAGIPPSVRVDGTISPLPDRAPMSSSDLRDLLFEILPARQRERFEAEMELDTSHTVPDVGRFRVNVFFQRNSVGAVFRAIPFKIVALEQLGLPPAVARFAEAPRGLVLVTGPTGSGKSTTLASLIDVINTNRACHIITVEDPIEFLHRHKRAVVNQREVGEDTRSFGEALKRALRQDPDVILVGELRDLETISTALTAAETGHLVFATLHTQDAPQSVDRIIDVFPAHQQQQVRIQLASSLQGVVTQQLLPRMRTRGRAVACEILVVTPAVRNLIREGKGHQLYSTMQAGGKYGMQTMDYSLGELVRTGAISLEVALEHCQSPADLRRLAGVAA
jgi:twitching motility protein PilT